MADDRAPCAGCGTLRARWEITVRDTWNLPREPGQKRAGSRLWCERCWKLILAQFHQAERLTTLKGRFDEGEQPDGTPVQLRRGFVPRRGGEGR